MLASNQLEKLIPSVVAAARAAGAVIMEVYNSDDFGVEHKADDSPLTRADRASDAVLQDALAGLLPDTPVLSEEVQQAEFSVRRDWERLWVVDPLDGTKEFLKRNGEFCVCIALVEQGVPSLGVIYAPVSDTVYYAWKNGGAYKSSAEEPLTAATRLERSPLDRGQEGLRVGVSRSHLRDADKEFLDSLRAPEPVPMGSALKFCAIADNQLDLYPRFGPTMEWDVAAGQVILEEAGGSVRLAGKTAPLTYNKEELRNPSFIAGVLRAE